MKCIALSSAASSPTVPLASPLLFLRLCCMQCVVFFPEEEQALRQACGRWTITFTRALQAHLQVGPQLPCLAAMLPFHSM